MKIYRVLTVIILVIALAVPALSGNDEKRAEFSSALAMYFGVTPENVDQVWETGAPSEEMAVVLRIAQLSNTSPVNIGKLCARGDSWRDIMGIRNLGVDPFYMMIAGEINSRIYAPIFEKYSAVAEFEWKSIILTDDEIINLVNLRFLASQYDYSVFKIMDMRDAGQTFLAISANLKIAKDALDKEEKGRKRQQAQEGSN